MTTGLTIWPAVLADPAAYVAAALARPFESITVAGTTFHGFQLAEDPTVPDWIAREFPGAKPALSFIRQSPMGQAEPHFIHHDGEMGDWTALVYLNPDPPADDGTIFWRHQTTGAIKAQPDIPDADWRETNESTAKWEPWCTVAAVWNRGVLFPAPWFHSRARFNNHGSGASARLVQIVFGTWVS